MVGGLESYRGDGRSRECVFCGRIVRGEFDREYAFGVVRFAPVNPVVAGHMLFVPRAHAEHPDADAVGRSMAAAESYGGERQADFNLITSSGVDATQTVPHIHVHYVPRRSGDGLALPWTGQ
ncbi:HIT family protein [Nocardia sp. NPDC057668]|uniref:HIT family protein n=1 Tax=Nocardia sp. NPDC057668 TaxID=3346202 RepID=UPI00366DF819